MGRDQNYTRLDKALLERALVTTRSQAVSYIKLGRVKVDGKIIKKPSWNVTLDSNIQLEGDQYVSRAAQKLASVAAVFELDFRGKTVLDVGSSTGGFTDFALQHGAQKVYAVDVGTNQLHPRLRQDPRITLYEKTDIRGVCLKQKNNTFNASECRVQLDSAPDSIVIDVSFISLTKILNHISTLMDGSSELIVMCKPQFEAEKHQINKGVIKNSAMRRLILKNFEQWLAQNKFTILNKSDSQIAGSKGNVERFYKLRSHKG